jgi:hypothetical protein
MNNESTDYARMIDAQADSNPLMATYNPLPPQAEPPVRFYWQEPWHEASPDAAVQAAFES